MSEFHDRRRWVVLKHRYKIKPLDFFELIVKQDSKCAICKAHFDFNTKKIPYSQQACVDHDHTTGKIRGLICRCCNLALGQMFDSPIWLQKAITYLEEHQMQLSTRRKRESHSTQVLNYMKRRGPITQATASHVFGCSRLASVIHRLRKQGHTIEVVYEQGIKGRFARYGLTKKA